MFYKCKNSENIEIRKMMMMKFPMPHPETLLGGCDR
jgi:hypothetical protein